MLTFLLALPFWVKIALLVLLVLSVLKARLVLTMGVCRSRNKLTGKTVIITGGNSGIGKETAIDLAKRGARVILACRDLKRADDARDDIIRESGNNNVVVNQLDLASLASVRQFASEILKNEPRLDILINNAGCVTMEKKLTDDGLEYQMQANYFGHFLLTNLLLGLLKKSAPSRIINVTSVAHSFIKTFDLNNLNAELYHNGSSFYNSIYYYSKLSIILSTRHLAHLISQSGVTVNCLCPGAVNTGIFRNASSLFQTVVSALIPIFFKTVKQGAQTTIHLAVADEVADVSGEYFTDCKISQTSKLGMDVGLAKKLWDISETLVKLTPEERQY
ncbi:retinol dehydrogenase 14-like [Daphnia pulex]|uniref:retinol dehydrogenase 14-like n=1 Tax=Daphnia pulex TaxID=6669 RepID=UPI001EDEAA9E|nr:retinol dehydrogenase 14-like [Daphnia pulex]